MWSLNGLSKISKEKGSGGSTPRVKKLNPIVASLAKDSHAVQVKTQEVFNYSAFILHMRQNLIQPTSGMRKST